MSTLVPSTSSAGADTPPEAPRPSGGPLTTTSPVSAVSGADTPSAADTPAYREVAAERRRGRARRGLVVAALAALVVVVFALSLMCGHRFYSPGEVVRVILGQDVPGAGFTVGTLRLPRALLAVVTGLCFGMGGVVFQTMLRNPLASPDIIGISSGASAAAVFALVGLSLSGVWLSVSAVVAGLATALAVYLLAYRGGVLGTRLVLIGIGVASMLDALTSYVLAGAGQWELQEATRWLTGSLNGASYTALLPVLGALLVCGGLLLGAGRNLQMLRLGDDSAAALGVRVEGTRVLVILAAVGLIAFATAASGPIAFVAFLSGPIAARLVGGGHSLLVPAGLVGAALVLCADFAGQWLLGTRFPVGVVTGVLGAPYLVYLIIRSNRSGGSL